MARTCCVSSSWARRAQFLLKLWRERPAEVKCVAYDELDRQIKAAGTRGRVATPTRAVGKTG